MTQLYKSLHKKVYESEDNFIFNSDIVDHYMNMLCKYDMFHEAIEARNDFIKHLVKEGTVDHQMRRAYVEIMCLHILCNEKFKIQSVIERMIQTDPSSMGKDEYNIGENMMAAVAK